MRDLAVPSGMIKLVCYDDREDSPTKGEVQEIHVRDLNYALVTIPPLVPPGLPDLSGHELMRRLHTRFNLPGIALSGYGMETDLAQMRKVGKVAFWAAFGGVVLPMAGGILVAGAFGLPLLWEGVFIGTVIQPLALVIALVASVAATRQGYRSRPRT